MGTWTDTNTRSRSVSQALTESAPTLSTDGVDLNGVSALTVVLHAPSGQTFSGGGTMLGYYYNGSEWAPAPHLDYAMGDATGRSAITIPSFPVVTPRGRFQLVPSSVTVSGGTTMTSDYLCTTPRGDAV